MEVKASVSKTIAESDVYGYAGISGDLNPLHVDQVAAAESKFGSRVAHGTLLLGFVSRVLGMSYPGNGTVLVGISAKFRSPVFIGDTVTARVGPAAGNGKFFLIPFEIIGRDSQRVVEGEATVLPPDGWTAT